ncbi:oligosaccharide flippase family protein [Clostridiales bacterium]|nr:oligosaccharide flippase family protein [Clostridiales bacterium]
MHVDNARKQIGFGATLSYISIVLNAVYGLAIAPFILRVLGEDNYGVYQSIASLSATIAVLDVGVSSTVQRYVAVFVAKKERTDKIENYVGMAAIQSSIIAVIILLVGGIVICILPSLYVTFSESQILQAKWLLFALVLNLILHTFENVFQGAISGHNDFVFVHSSRIISLIVRIVAILILLPIFANALVIAIIMCAIEVILITIESMYLKRKYGIRPKLHKWEGLLFKESLIYTIIVFLQSLIAQIDNNLDNVVIGAEMGAKYVTVYSFGLSIYAMFTQLSVAISGVMLPTVAKRIENKASYSELESLVIRVGKIQFIIIGAALTGFMVLGKEFINLWLGSGFEDVYGITLVLMTPTIFELSQNVSLSILRAENKISVRLKALGIGAFINLLITVLGVRIYGYFAACFGTAMSVTIGSLVLMNIYYYKQYRFNPIRIYGSIMWKTLLCLLPAMICTYIIKTKILCVTDWGRFLLMIICFMLVYCAFLVTIVKPQKIIK